MTKLSEKFPAIPKPDVDFVEDNVVQYIAKLEERVKDLSQVVDLLVKMDVFPDMLNTIAELSAKRRAEAEALESEDSPGP